MRPRSSENEPRRGTPKPKTVTPVARHIWKMPMRAKGSELARTSSCHGRIGVTMICSRVPISFSRTTPIAESSMVMTMRTMARTAGT